MIYFQLENEPSLVASPQTYVAVGIQYTDSQIFVGQNFYTLDTTSASPLITAPAASSLYGYLDTINTITSISGRGFVTTTYVFKAPPSILYGYSFLSSEKFSIKYGKNTNIYIFLSKVLRHN